jgi:hypothetical protein
MAHESNVVKVLGLHESNDNISLIIERVLAIVRL